MRIRSRCTPALSLAAALVLAGAVSAVSAVPAGSLGGTTFALSAGAHRAEGVGVGVVAPSGQRDRTLRFQIRFDASCRYRTTDPRNQADWNKAMGISTAMIHQTSLRLGWRYAPDADRIELGLYAYVQGKRISQRVGAVRLKAWTRIELRLQPNRLSVKVGSTHVERAVDLGPASPLTALTFVLRTCYFGGDETAPHPMKVTVKGVSIESR